MNRIYFLLFPLWLAWLFIASAYANIPEPPSWFAGTLFAGDDLVVPRGEINIQPYLFVVDNYGIYDEQWNRQNTPSLISTTPLMDLTVGLMKNMDIETIIPYQFNSTQGKSDSGFSDIVLMIGYQVLREKLGTWIPNLEINLSETFPSGKYDNLNPKNLGADELGQGSYLTSFSANLGKLLSLSNGKFLKLYLTLSYSVATSTHVTGFNVYNGGIGTEGEVHVGNQFLTDIGLEYGVTRHWVPALDILMTASTASTFTGFPGITDKNNLAKVGLPSNFNLSLVPQIEYDFSADVAVNAGVWFSVIGRNSPAFIGGVFYLNIYT